MFINIGGVRINTAHITSYQAAKVHDDEKDKDIQAVVIRLIDMENMYIKCPSAKKAEKVVEYFDQFLPGDRKIPSIKKDIKKTIHDSIFVDKKPAKKE